MDAATSAAGVLRRHPHLYELSTWPWLDRLSRHHGRHVTLGSVPEAEWDRLAALGFDLVYLMGVWRRSALGRQVARSDTRLFGGYDAALPGWQLADVPGSPYCIAGYSPDPRIGTWDDLDAVRRSLARRGMRLILDFVPNHTAFDHPWVAEHPRRYITGSLERFRASPDDFRLVEPAGGPPAFIACGRDPYFPAWTDVAQLNYFEEDTRAAMVAQLAEILHHCDGVRCDMAMLVLNDIFAATWGRLPAAGAPAREFWSDVRRAVPDAILIAEVYWDLEWRLQELGFSFTYDKRLYDRLAHGSPSGVRDHLRADAGYQARSARFLENHDEPRSFAVFGAAGIQSAAALSATTPGLRFYYDGQFEGRARFAPVQLGRWQDEPAQPELGAFYARLLAAADAPVFHDGEWALLDVMPAGGDGDDAYQDLIAYRWKTALDLRVVVVNPGGRDAQGHVAVAPALEDLHADTMLFTDAAGAGEYAWERRALMERGLYVSLGAGRAHVFTVTPESSRAPARRGGAAGG